MKRLAFVVVAPLLWGSLLAGQNVARSVSASEGLVQVVFQARANVCGDGVSYIQTMNGGNYRTYTGNSSYSSRESWRGRPCSLGTARALASVEAGQVTRLSIFVGPVPGNGTRTINASASVGPVG